MKKLKCPKCGRDLVDPPNIGILLPVLMCSGQNEREKPTDEQPLCDYVGPKPEPDEEA